MNKVRIIKNRKKELGSIIGHINVWLLLQSILLTAVSISCESDVIKTNWYDNDILTIGQYLEKNQKEFSKSYKLMVEGKMLSPLYAYNPYGSDYTLFLPTDEAIESFIQQNPDYGSFDEMLLDTGFIRTLTRYHTVNSKVSTDEFPDGALRDSTLTGDRLSFGFYTDGENQIIKVNKAAPIIKSNLEMTNGYIHIISEVLQKVEISGYDWLQQQDDYSILAEAMELSGIIKKIWWDKYTILAEPDSIYHQIGIFDVKDLRSRIANLGISNALYKFVGYHIVGGEFYLNDFYWGNKKYWTKSGKPLMIDVGLDIRINSGVDNYGISISEAGDTTVIDYIRLIWKDSNTMTKTGPLHSISDVLFFEPLPDS